MFGATKRSLIVCLLSSISLFTHAQTGQQVKVVVVPLGGDEAPKEKVIFITKQHYTNGNLGGLAGADADCQADADAEGSKVKGKIFKAWLGGPATDPLAGERAFNVFNLPYVSPNGDPLADSYSDLLGQAPWPFLHLSADGVDTTDTTFTDFLWTGREFDGEPSVQNCKDWTAHDYETYVLYFAETTPSSRTYTPYADSLPFCAGDPGARFRIACFEQ